LYVEQMYIFVDVLSYGGVMVVVHHI